MERQWVLIQKKLKDRTEILRNKQRETKKARQKKQKQWKKIQQLKKEIQSNQTFGLDMVARKYDSFQHFFLQCSKQRLFW